MCIQELFEGRAYFKNFNCQKQLAQNIDQLLHQVQHWRIEMALLSTSPEKIFVPIANTKCRNRLNICTLSANIVSMQSVSIIGLLQDSLSPGDEAKDIFDPFR